MTDFDLRTVPLFERIPEADLDRLSGSLQTCRVSEGEVLFSEGDEGDRAYIITDGEIEILKETVDRQVRIAVLTDGGVLGEMALLTGEKRNATAKALRETNLVSIPKATFDLVLSESAPATHALFDVFLKRWAEQEDRLRQSERMAQIGVLTAGLAHEMNNPASAVRRGAERLGAAIEQYTAAARELPRSVEIPVDLAGRERPILSGMERSDREDRLAAALGSMGIDDAWPLATSLAEAGITSVDVERLPGEHAIAIVRVLAARAEVMSLTSEIDEGSKRLSELVGALKSYSFLDQAPVQEVDVTKGIEDTLLILRSKTGGITIDRDYGGDLPLITAFGSQLNQVWTNLIDNAADSLTESATPDPRIAIKAEFGNGCITVTIEDNGPGIPPEVQSRIFEAFYTTKEPGKGTGLGLDSVYNIVVKQHRGAIDVASEPGRTRFIVSIPIDPDNPVR
jgi:signal transduction histidine kinase